MKSNMKIEKKFKKGKTLFDSPIYLNKEEGLDELRICRRGLRSFFTFPTTASPVVILSTKRTKESYRVKPTDDFGSYITVGRTTVYVYKGTAKFIRAMCKKHPYLYVSVEY